VRVLVVNAGSSSLKLSALNGDEAVWWKTTPAARANVDAVRAAIAGAVRRRDARWGTGSSTAAASSSTRS
jgi:acetate kinase